ncbi:YraN family protein [Nocardioides sp. NPDC057772]|uniref:YraN family protein n=1 Tax=Nocardioides sp. NPDC057772 TaxID=3346245 RepID=UPI00366C508A
MSSTAPARIALGNYGESVAERHLVEAGMTVLDRNWRCDDGEIDLVLREGETLVVCEVKTRSHDGCGTPHEAVDKTKLDRLKRLAVAWLQQHDVRAPGIRIDLVAVMHAPRGSALVEHVRGL